MILKVFEAFAGIGTQKMALRNLGIEHEVVAISEIDKYALKSYEAIHGEVNNLGDITKIKVEDIPYHDLFTYSFPCQDISVAGLGKGLAEGTRSSLLWECERIIEAKRPTYLLMENVKNLVGKKFKADFERWLKILECLGYTNYWQVLNAKDYGIPQNRERVFCVSVLGKHEPYIFPKKEELRLRLKDLLEDEVDERYYLSKEQVNRIKFSTFHTNARRIQEKDYCDTLCARDWKDPKCVKVEQIGRYDTENRKNSSRFRVYGRNGLSPSLTTMGGGGLEPLIKIKNATKRGYIEAAEGDGIDLEFPDSKTRRGRVQKDLAHTLDTSDSKGVVIGASRGRNVENLSDRSKGISTEQRLEINTQGTSNTITSVQKDNLVIEKEFRIRKLTPKECWRLMGISDEDFSKAEKVNSNTQLYKQAGNAIVVDVLMAIFRNLFLEEVQNER